MDVILKSKINQLIESGRKKKKICYDKVFANVRKYVKSSEDLDEVIEKIEGAGVKVYKKSATWEWIESIAIAFVLAMFIRTFFIQAFKIPSGSMRMTLIERDRLMVNKLRYGPMVPFTDYRLPGFSHWKRGDVIVFKYPVDPKKDFIKRLIALGGETVEIRNGDIYIDGKIVKDPHIKDIYYYNRGEYGRVGDKVVVPEGYLFVLGDNSASSHDSRYWGFVPEDNVIGKASFIYWPFNRIRWIN